MKALRHKFEGWVGKDFEASWPKWNEEDENLDCSGVYKTRAGKCWWQKKDWPARKVIVTIDLCE